MSNAPDQELTPADVFKASARTGNLPKWFLHTDNREDYIVNDRAALALVMRERLGLSWVAIGRAMKRDRTAMRRLVESRRENKDVIEVADRVCISLGLETIVMHTT